MFMAMARGQMGMPCCCICLIILSFGVLCMSNEDWILPYKPQSIKIRNETQIWVFDGLLSEEQLDALQAYVTPISGNYHFMLQDLETGLQNGVTPFYNKMDKSEFMEFEIHDKTKALLESTIREKVHLEEVQTEFLHSLDPKPPVKETCVKGVYHAGIFLNSFWQHNSYGQISFYTHWNDSVVVDEARLDIAHTVHPKPARLVIWPACATFAAHPPAVNYFSNLFMVKMRFAVTQQGIVESKQPDETPEVKFGDFKFTNADADREIDYAKHLKRKFYDSKKRGIYVFDDLFTLEELRHFARHLLATAELGVSQYDGGPLEDHDNVQWIGGFSVNEFLKTPVWVRMKELLVFLTNESDWYPYNVALNYIRPADHTRIHPDAERHQHEYTYLLYLTENITQNSFGETIFVEEEKLNLDGIHQFTHPGGEEFEPIAAVWPKFGRVVIFRNIIEHSARPLSTAQLGCRYSFAVKASRSRRLAVIKQLYEAMEGAGPGRGEESKLSMELSTGQHDSPLKSPWTMELLEEKLATALQGHADMQKENLEMYKEILKSH